MSADREYSSGTGRADGEQAGRVAGGGDDGLEKRDQRERVRLVLVCDGFGSVVGHAPGQNSTGSLIEDVKSAVFPRRGAEAVSVNAVESKVLPNGIHR